MSIEKTTKTAPDSTQTPNSAAPQRQRRAGKTQAILLLAGSCMPVLGTVLLSPVLPRVAAHYADIPAAALLVPLVLTAPALAMAILSPFAGILADRLGRKRALIISMVAYALLGTAPLWIQSLLGIVISRIGVGIAEAFIITICTTLILDYYAVTERSKYLGLQAMLGPVAASVFMILGGILGRNDWRAPFWAYGVAIVLAVLMARYLWEPTESTHRTQTATRIPWRALAVPVFVSLFGGIFFYTLVVHLPFVVTELGMTDSAKIGLAVGVSSIATAIGALSFRWVARFGASRILPWAFGLTALGCIGVALATTPAVAVAAATLTGLGTGVMLPTLLTWAVDGLEYHERGRGTGIWNAAFWSGQFLTPIIVGALAVILGGLQGGIGAIGVTAAIAAILASFLFSVAAKRRLNSKAGAR